MITKEKAIRFLMRDGDLRIPVSRYGTRTSDAAEVAWALFEIFVEANGAPDDDFALLDGYMSSVVDDHDDVETLIREHGTEAHKSLLDDRW